MAMPTAGCTSDDSSQPSMPTLPRPDVELEEVVDYLEADFAEITCATSSVISTNDVELSEDDDRESWELRTMAGVDSIRIAACSQPTEREGSPRGLGIYLRGDDDQVLGIGADSQQGSCEFAREVAAKFGFEAPPC